MTALRFTFTPPLLLLLLLPLLMLHSTHGQLPPPVSNNFLDAHETAMEVKAEYDQEDDFFRERLTWQADDFGYYFTSRMRYALMEATQPAQGAALQGCAAAVTEQCRESINRFDTSLQELRYEGNQIHSSVLRKMMEMNVMNIEELELFYYYHYLQLEAAQERLFDWHIVELGQRWLEMWLDYFTFADDLDECIVGALEQGQK